MSVKRSIKETGTKPSQVQFERARNETVVDIRRIIAENAAAGRLKSGATAKQAIAAFGKRSSASLAQALEEDARRVSHRGREWRNAMAAIRVSLDQHIARAQDTMEPALRVAGATNGAAKRAVDEMAETVANDLRAQLAEFDEGWTSPNPMKWQERHPVWYAVALLGVGATISEAARLLLERVTN